MSEGTYKICNHNWETKPYVLLSYPAQHERVCKNCGRKQRRFETSAEWRDVK